MICNVLQNCHRHGFKKPLRPPNTAPRSLQDPVKPPPGGLQDAQEASETAQDSPRRPPEPRRTVPRRLPEPPGPRQGASKTLGPPPARPPRPSKTAPRRLQDPPGPVHEASKALQGRSMKPPRPPGPHQDASTTPRYCPKCHPCFPGQPTKLSKTPQGLPQEPSETPPNDHPKTSQPCLARKLPSERT